MKICFFGSYVKDQFGIPSGNSGVLLKKNLESQNVDVVECYESLEKTFSFFSVYWKLFFRHRKLDYDKDSVTNFGGLNLGPDGEKVNMRTLDSIFMPKINFIKIDVEGAEKLVIYGARKLIEAYKPLVFYEQNYKTITAEMIDMFKLSKKLINFDLKEFFIRDLEYSHLHKVGANYLAISKGYL